MPTLYERNLTASSDDECDGTNWVGQSFAPSVTHVLTKIVLRAALFGGNDTPGTVTVSVRATTAGLPSGADLDSATFDGNSLPSGSWAAGEAAETDYQTIEIAFTGAIILTAGIVYAIVIRAPSGDQFNSVTFRRSDSATEPNPYTGGAAKYSGDSGVTWSSTSWTGDTNADFRFEEWGIAGGGWLWVEGLKLHYTDETNSAEQVAKYESEQETF